MNAAIMLWLGIAIIATVILSALVVILVLVRRTIDNPPLPPFPHPDEETHHEP